MNEYENKKRHLILILRVIEDYLGVHDANKTHNSVRLDDKTFAINPFNSHLIRGIRHGDLLNFSYDPNFEWTANSGIPYILYEAQRQFYLTTDLNYFIHFHDHAVIAVANRDEGLKKISQDSLHIHKHIHHKKYTGLFDGHLSHDFTDVYKNEGKTVILIQGHGGVVMAKTPQEALIKSYMLIRACRTQVLDFDSTIDMPDEQFTDELNNNVGQSMLTAFKRRYWDST